MNDREIEQSCVSQEGSSFRMSDSVWKATVMYVMGCLLAHSSWAVNVPMANPSFEEPFANDGTFLTTSPPPGWGAVGSVDFGFRTVGVLNPNTTTLYVDPVPDGRNVGVVFLGTGVNNSPVGLVQTLSATLEARTHYTLTVEVGNIANDAPPPNNSFEFDGFPGYRIEFVAGSNVMASDENTLLPGEGQFLSSTVEVSVASSHVDLGQPITIRLINLDQTAGIEVNFDDVRLDAVPIPDPTISIVPQSNGVLRLDFIGDVSESFDLLTWMPLDVPPMSPLFIAPTGTMRFFRSSN